MRIVRGKEIPSTLTELILPSTTALLVVDVQNDWCSEGGAASRTGHNLRQVREMLPQLLKLVDAARRKEVLRIFIQTTIDPAGRGDTGASLYYREVKGARGVPQDLQYALDGTWGHKFIPELSITPHDIVLRKSRPSAFAYNNLATLLRANRIRSAIVAGVLTSGSISTTAGDALSNDFYPIVATDCIADYDEELHQAALAVLDSRYTMLPVGMLIEEWKRYPDVEPPRIWWRLP